VGRGAALHDAGARHVRAAGRVGGVPDDVRGARLDVPRVPARGVGDAGERGAARVGACLVAGGERGGGITAGRARRVGGRVGGARRRGGVTAGGLAAAAGAEREAERETQGGAACGRAACRVPFVELHRLSPSSLCEVRRARGAAPMWCARRGEQGS
jgi:hypothetical protein